jgi:putative heme-binding domain-containing protein
MLRLLALVLLAPQQPPLVAPTDPLTPQEQLKKFRLPPGFEIQLVACEPEIHKPMNLAFDDRGRLYVTSSLEYPFPAKDGTKPRDTVQVLEDFGPDGRARKVRTFADGLNIPIGILPTAKGVLVHSIPKLHEITDTDGDGLGDRREVLMGDVGFADTHGMVNAFTPWVDGWVYSCHGFANRSRLVAKDGSTVEMHSGNTFRMRPDASHVEIYTHGQVNPFGLSFDALGNLYSSDCHTMPIYQLLRGGWYPTFDGRHDGLGHAPNMMTHLHGSTAIAGVLYYAAAHFPEPYRDTAFVCNPVTARINHDRLEPHGSSWKAVEQPDFVKCDDPWFRPVDLKLAPDGSIYVADFYNRIIGHYEVPLTHPGRDRERGRIWRIVWTGEPPRPMPDLFKLGPDELAALLADPNLQVRVRATHQLVARRAKGPALQALVSPSPFARAHALWVLERLGGLDEAQARKLAGDGDRLVRVHLLKALAERRNWTFEAELVRGMLKDSDPFAKRAAAEGLGLHPEAANLAPLVELWKSAPADDTHLVHMARMALRDQLAAVGYAAAQGISAGRLVNVSLGIPKEEAARYVLDQLKAGAVEPGLQLGVLRHSARYGPADAIPEVIEAAKGRGDAIATFRALQQALQERGMALPAAAADWIGQAAKQALAAEAHGPIREALKLAREMRLRSCQDEVARLAEGRLRVPDIRNAAVDALAALDPAAAVPVLARILAGGQEPMDLRLKAAAALAGTNDAASRQALFEQLKTAPLGLGVQIAVGLAGSPQGAELLLAAVEGGKASPRLLVDRAVDGRLKALRIDPLLQKLAKLTASLPPEDDRIKGLMDSRRAGFTRAKPDAGRGLEVYKKSCAGCHRIDGLGNKVGPELDGVWTRGTERLLEDILDPNRNVDEAFRASLIQTQGGQVISGLVLREEGAVLIVQEAADKETRVALKDIAQRRLSQLSPMPSNVAEPLPEADFYDLLAFLLRPRK